ncbi:sn-glycerol-3-phosphate ABC transporter ATP-binding protein UgpC [Nitratireductor sp. XY-223]|uniref:sn-glycerol-3-phosphate ABC transporter ATP-binding protein UgpC n=1 Tax=Nitratireductor sp. XY-223 TaxID=2561926 RepID=UPI0010AA2CBF|nr:sn-glycerol-3-phosphate ABC transporter ATP-binding protein UgpC [Nitratireductor sp. XY-223]
MAKVVIDNVRKVYPNGTEALSPSSLSIEDGEFIVLVGPSGCGKSTLLRMIAGLEDITEGTISIGERVVNALDPAERDIAMVFQNYALYPHMSVYKNMAYGLKNRGMPKADIDAAVQKAAKLLHIEEFLARKPSQLSGGQRQRVAMGRAIVRDPALFLFDEPLSNLDAKLRNQMRIEIRKLQRELGVTSIYVTHDQIEAMTMADRIAVLNTGKIEQIGTPAQIYHTPASIFVASFMGAPPMNILDGHYNGNGGLEIKDLGHVAVDHTLEVTGDIQVGIRPENVEIHQAEEPHTIPIKVDFLEELGAGRLLHTTIGNTPFIAHLDNEHQINGETVFAHLPARALHLFDASTGRRV